MTGTQDEHPDLSQQHTAQEPLDPPVESPIVLAHIIAEAVRDLTENFHVHHWNILGARNPQKGPIHPRNQVWPTTLVLLRCKECNLPQTEELDGLWTLAQIRALAGEEGENGNE